jgi:V8-like Glu-specific endopeptidase
MGWPVRRAFGRLHRVRALGLLGLAGRRDVLGGRKPFRVIAACAAVAVFALVMGLPTDGGAASLGRRIVPPDSMTAADRTGLALGGLAFSGEAAVGALFGYSSGKLGGHFCTASVVHSPAGDLALTAAHCVSGKTGQIAFVPGYADGKAPYGIWLISRVYTDEAWESSQDPDDDVAFLRISPASDGIPIEDITGAETLGTGWHEASTLVEVIGYPDGSVRPVWCVNWTKNFSPTQLQFDCGGYTDGTSGGPFIADLSVSTGQGTVIGVIGGYEQGGLTPSVSYSSVFGTAVQALYRTAVAGH